MRAVCIFCGSSPGFRPVYAEAAARTGRILAESIQRRVEDPGRRRPVHDLSALAPGQVRLADQRALHGGGGESLVLERDDQVRAQAQEVPAQRPTGLAPGPLGPIHVEGQADHEGGGTALVHEPEEGGGVVCELGPPDDGMGGGHRPLSVAEGDPQGLLTGIHTRQGALPGEGGGQVVERHDRHGASYAEAAWPPTPTGDSKNGEGPARPVQPGDAADLVGAAREAAA